MAEARKKPAEYNKSMLAVKSLRAAGKPGKRTPLPTEEEWTKNMLSQGRTVLKRLGTGDGGKATMTEKLGG